MAFIIQRGLIRRGRTVTEIDVAITDYLLTLLCLWFAGSLYRRVRRGHELWQKLWMVFFVSVSAGSLIGGTVHGFFSDNDSLGHQILWPLTMLCIGVTTSTGWVLIGMLISGENRLKYWRFFATAIFVVYAAVVLFYSQRFVVAILNYLPAMVMLLIAALYGYFRFHARRMLMIAGGIFVSFVAAGAQQGHFAIHPQYFNHNSTFHAIQALGFWLIFAGAANGFPAREHEPAASAST